MKLFLTTIYLLFSGFKLITVDQHMIEKEEKFINFHFLIASPIMTKIKK